jgi:hypothetical protein
VGGEPVMRWDGRVIGIRRGPVTTVTTELPQIPGAITALWSVKPVAPRGFFAFSYVLGEERMLAPCSRHAKPVSAIFAWESQTVILENSRHAVLHRAADGQVTIWGGGSPRISMEKNQP